MNKFYKKIPIKCIDYIKKQNLEKLLKIKIKKNQAFLPLNETINKKNSVPYPPDWVDLVRLHKLIRLRKATTVLEFGLGFSTLIIADALYKNKLQYRRTVKYGILRNNNIFQCHSLDASKKWINYTKKKIPHHLKKIVKINFSDIKITQYNNQICHVYKKIPNINPDFIYLDGPNPSDVKGSINGISFSNSDMTVMAADLLLIEPLLVPRTFILIDGRTNNYHFLKNNFKRKYEHFHYKKMDVSTFELNETPLGNINNSKIKFCLNDEKPIFYINFIKKNSII
jgi:hypothetical protein